MEGHLLTMALPTLSPAAPSLESLADSLQLLGGLLRTQPDQRQDIAEAME